MSSPNSLRSISRNRQRTLQNGKTFTKDDTTKDCWDTQLGSSLLPAPSSSKTYDFYNSSDDDEPYDDTSSTSSVETTVQAPQWLSMIPLQRVRTIETLSQDPSCDARDRALRQELLSTCVRRDDLSKKYSEYYHSITRLESELKAEKEAAASAEADSSSKGPKARSRWAIKEPLGLGRNKSERSEPRSEPSKESIIKKLKYEQAEIDSQQKVVFASFDRINGESKHLADTLWNEKVGQYSQNISDGLTEVRYNSFKSDEVQAIPDIRKAILESHSHDSADSQ
ncbi:hypothetical protein L486_08432 [Kwoniella mangroviensis CBS 10435]|uniref:Uncharacterized protein n=1 Tax=Kwoniella mangroviensis CBS 10435 TaxID=1331196 RepID=A0A1B9IET9_9TREE|nr:hypothetical protein L486_08432 [Kwoniella mangroviensis CBS 10435]